MPDRDQWLSMMVSWMLPIDYYQAVFTLPHLLNPLIGFNAALCYQLQADAEREAIRRVAADPVHGVGAFVGLVMVLHSWGQKLLRHIHFHVLLPGGGFSLKTGEWITFPARKFFLDRDVLTDTYRDLYLKKLIRRYRDGQLRMPPELSHLENNEAAFRQWLAPLHTQRWWVHCGEPKDCFRQDGAFRYLSAYVTGTAISDARIISQTEDGVVLRYKDYTEGRARKTLELSGPEFVRRFALHILPPRFWRVRYGGYLGANKRDDALRLARAALGVPQLEESTAESSVAVPANRALRLDAQELPEENEQMPDNVSELPQPADAPGSSGNEAALTNGEETPADDLDADCKMLCPNCGERKLLWQGTICARMGWAVSRGIIPRRARQRITREVRKHFGLVPAAPRAPPQKGGWSCDPFAP